MTLGEFTIRLAVALLMGSIIGVERQWRQRMAGLRTNALVSTGAALFVLVSPLSGPSWDPTRVAAQVVSGIGFLAGAVIFREGLSLRGLNTAATLWSTAAVGTLAGSGYLWQSVIGAGAVLVANVLLPPIVRHINTQTLVGTELVSAYEVRVICASHDEERIRALLLGVLHKARLALHAISSEDIANTDRVEVTARVTTGGKADRNLEQIVGKLSAEAAITAAHWEVLHVDSEDHAASTADA